MDWESVNKQMAKETAKKGLMAKILALPMTVRVIGAVVCLGLLVGAYGLVAKIPDSKDEGEKAGVTVISDIDIENMENADFTAFTNYSESEIVAAFAGGLVKHESDDYFYYEGTFVLKERDKYQHISISFDKDIFGSEYPVSISLSGNIANLYGITSETAPDDAKAILESNGFIAAGETRSVYDGVEYVRTSYYSAERIDIEIGITVSEGKINNVDILKMWDFGPDGEIIPITEAVIEEEDEEIYPEDDAVTDETVEEPVVEEEPVVDEPEVEEAPAMTNDEAHNILEEYWGKNCAAGGAWYYFVDLTGDGIDEMFNIVFDYEWGDGMTQIYMIQDGSVVGIDEIYSGTTNGNMIEYYLYSENNRNFILEYNSFMREGFGEIYYKIYGYDANGNEAVIYENSYSGDMLSAEGESASETIYGEFKAFKGNCPGIMYQTIDGGMSDLW